MKKFFRYLRRQPKTVRDNYALLFSSIFVLLILALWLPARWSGVEKVEVVTETETKEVPFSTLIKGIKDQFATLFVSVKDEPVAAPSEFGEAVNLYQGSANDFVLPKEEVEALKQKLIETEVGSTKAVTETYQEVLIATTSASTSLETDAD